LGSIGLTGGTYVFVISKPSTLDTHPLIGTSLMV
jgi:hypothetical protein